MVDAEDPRQVGQQLGGQSQRPGRITGPPGPGRDVAAGDQRVGVVDAEDPRQVGQQLGGQLQRPGRITGLPGPGRDVVAGRQRAGVVGTEDPRLVGQQLGEQSQRPGRITGLPGPESDVATGRQRVGVVDAHVLVLLAKEESRALNRFPKGSFLGELVDDAFPEFDRFGLVWELGGGECGECGDGLLLEGVAAGQLAMQEPDSSFCEGLEREWLLLVG